MKTLFRLDLKNIQTASKYMDMRKVAKVHQNVLVFYKGDVNAIKREFPRIEVDYESDNL